MPLKARAAVLFFVSFFLFLPQVSAQSGSQKLLSIDNYFQLKDVGNPVISPDGEWIAYTMRTTDFEKDETETRIWMVSVDGGEPLPMTAKGYSAGDPQWSPGGSYLSFTASRGEEEKTQVWVLDRRGGEAQQLTDIEQGVSGYQWSPDGSRLLLLIKDKDENESGDPEPYVIDRRQFKRDYTGYLDRRRTHIYAFTPGDTSAVQLTYGDYDHSSPKWSPDGTRILFSSNRTENPDGNFNTDIWVVDAGTGEKDGGLVQVSKNPGSDHSPSWSPSGDRIAYVSSIEPDKIWYATNHLAIASADGSGGERVLTEYIDRNISSPEFMEDGSRIRFVLEDAGESQLASVSVNGSDLRREVQGDLSVGAFDQQGPVTALTIAHFSSPEDIYTYENGELNRLTSANEELFSGLKMPDVEEITFNSADGTEIHGFLVKPVEYREGSRVPTLLWIHGGPVAQFEHSFRFEPHLFASNGYAVLMVNPRGSSGYGQAFSEVLFADWGNKDYEDVMAAVDYAVERGIADPERLGVGGWSYGGILTNYVITKTDRFEGAISGASETLYRSNYGHDHYQLHWEMELGLPWETPEKWERISPFNDVANITTPTLWIGGAEDWNVPILGSEQMYQAMKRLGRETLLVVYPGEHHGIRRPAFQKDRYERYLQWFGKYVKGQDGLDPSMAN
ncbi:S9 family peptidase [Rhodohalobacter mucosus]|uniref:S9 family peptidase n=2 Tax=Rhodohalobacter mucosus TaxID=2079485 RepID=A0A316TYX3_9BACT|nr:S9 family peptidase [Rhodohalobacter mucosus]